MFFEEQSEKIQSFELTEQEKLQAIADRRQDVMRYLTTVCISAELIRENSVLHTVVRSDNTYYLLTICWQSTSRMSLLRWDTAWRKMRQLAVECKRR